MLAGAVDLLRKRDIRFTAVIAGDGPDQSWLERALRKSGSGHGVRMLGAVSSDDMAPLMAAADVLFLPSRSEGIALALYEAMASGTAVVGARVGGQAELVTEDCGYLIERSSPGEEAEEYARVLGQLLTDRERRLAMGAAARARVEIRFFAGTFGAARGRASRVRDRAAPYGAPTTTDPKRRTRVRHSDDRAHASGRAPGRGLARAASARRRSTGHAVRVPAQALAPCVLLGDAARLGVASTPQRCPRAQARRRRRVSGRVIGITGASGFLGTSLLRHLAGEPGIRVVALTRTLGPSAVAPVPSIEWRQLDLGSKEDCRAFVADVDVIVHLAHTNTPLTSNRDLPSDASANMGPTLMLLQAIRDAGKHQHVVYPSSGGALYRATVDGAPVHEECPVEPLSSYGILKLAIERYLRMGADEGWMTATVLRIGNPYGVLLPTERLQGFIGVALHQLLDGRPVRVFGDLDNVRDYVHLDDVCRAFRLGLERKERFSIYNIGTGRGVSVRQLIDLFAQMTGRQVEVEYDELSQEATRLPPWVVLDPEKARRELGWRAVMELEDGIRQMWEAALA